ncbi:hypothetical protein CSIRO_3065 [Bradyrhizobiaceae bacterium SG-6C]|nr:hypothetical protein CSIRO_3065 [Bradyrhizobiaceae bacterium SG-6C]
MPTPAELVTNIKSLALVGATGSALDTPRIYGYFNMAYRIAYEKMTARYPGIVRSVQTVVMAAGVGTLAIQPLHILKVRDAGNNYARLEATDADTVEDDDPALSATGNPSRYWVEGFTTIKTHPLNNTSLSVAFTPNPESLDENSTEDDIKIPPVFHDVLTWETLKLMAYDERDKIVGAELAFNKDQYDDAYDRLYRHIDAKMPQKAKQVKAYLG